jgi:hypothetical protein
MNSSDSNMAANAIAHAATMAGEAWKTAAYERERPVVVFQPRLTRDGNMWCFLLGENLHEGVAGFGETPYLASYAFDKAFNGERAIAPQENRDAG